MWQTAAAILAGLLLSGLLMLIALGLVARAQHRREHGRHPPRAAAALRAEAGRLEMIAVAAFEEAAAASASVAEGAAALAEAEAARDLAWQEYDEASKALAHAQQHEPLPTPAAPPVELRHAAWAAYQRGELTSDAVLAVWQRAQGWDGALDQHARELSRLRADRAAAWRRYCIAAHAHRQAKRAAEQAQDVEQALIDEAAETARAAQVAAQHTDSSDR